MNIFSKSLLFGNNSFFNNPSYENALKNEFNTSAACFYQSSQKIKKNTVNSISSWLAIRILKTTLCPKRKRPVLLGTQLSNLKTEWKYKRITILVDGNSIDATLMVRPSTANNKKWAIISVGRDQRYEDRLTEKAFQLFLKNTESNAILFNYSKMGASTGTRDPQSMITAYKAVLEFLEDEEKGIGAKKIIGYGYSIGGGVQGEALKTHDLLSGQKKGIQYLFIKDRTFSELKAVVKSYTKGLLGWIIPSYSWNLDCAESSTKLAKLQIPEIIIQTSDQNLNPVSDGVISKNASLKQKIGTLPHEIKKHKWYIDIKKEGHKDLHAYSIECFVHPLSSKINEIFQKKTATPFIDQQNT